MSRVPVDTKIYRDSSPRGHSLSRWRSAKHVPSSRWRRNCTSDAPPHACTSRSPRSAARSAHSRTNSAPTPVRTQSETGRPDPGRDCARRAGPRAERCNPSAWCNSVRRSAGRRSRQGAPGVRRGIRQRRGERTCEATSPRATRTGSRSLWFATVGSRHGAPARRLPGRGRGQVGFPASRRGFARGGARRAARRTLGRSSDGPCGGRLAVRAGG